MKHYGFRKFIGFSLMAVFFSACSPLAPSVSKLSNAEVQKTSTDEATSDSGNFKVPSATSDSALKDSANPGLAIVTRAEFETLWPEIHSGRTSLELGSVSFDHFMKHWRAEFSNGADSRLKGMDALTAKPTVYLVLSPKAGESKKKFRESVALIREQAHITVAPCLTVLPGNCSSDWEVKLNDSSTKTGADEISGELKKALQEHLVGIAIEF